MLSQTCKNIEKHLPLTGPELLTPFDLLQGHPWAETARDPITNYYSCLYGVARAEQPRKILEIGTAFGMSAATFLSASPGIELFVGLDLGIYGDQLEAKGNNIEFARSRIHDWCRRRQIDPNRVRFYRANTQPIGEGDNEDLGQDIPRWSQLHEVMRLLQSHEFDLIFVDGKHTNDGLLNDLQTFWPFLKPGGLMICDDLHDPIEYANTFSWVGHTWRSYLRFLESRDGEISEHFLWNFPQVPPAGKNGARPFGLIRKAPLRFPLVGSAGFEPFDSEAAMQINRARQDHLAALGLELANQSVLEVGAGVGWHTGFFEKLGCRVLSTEARLESVAEHLRRFPYRQSRVEVADLSVPGTHDRFGVFDIVYCYGTLYHLTNPGLCLSDLSRICGKLFLLETCVNYHDNGDINLEREDPANPNQSFEGMGCRPGRDWVMAELKKHFPYVYATTTQPDFTDFELTWPTSSKAHGVVRAVFVASRQPLNLPTLIDHLPDEQSRLAPVLSAPPPAVASAPTPLPAAPQLEEFCQLDPQTGQIRFPEGVQRVWLDVGAHECEHTLPELLKHDDLAVIAFEPLREKWELLRARHPRLIALPYAVSAVNGSATFYEAECAACSSLLPYNAEGHAQWKVKDGLAVKQQHIVPTIRLEEILMRLPFVQVDFLKIDAQGHDLEVVKSAGAFLAKIHKLKLEVAVTLAQLYAGGATKEEAVIYLESQGFQLVATESQTNGQEENLTFVNTSLHPESSNEKNAEPGAKSATSNDIPPAGVAVPSAEFTLMRTRLGRMLNRAEPLSEAELSSGTEALGFLFRTENLKDYIHRYSCLFPPTLLPLLVLYLAEAWKTGNEPLAAGMEQVYGLLTDPAADAKAGQL